MEVVACFAPLFREPNRTVGHCSRLSKQILAAQHYRIVIDVAHWRTALVVTYGCSWKEELSIVKQRLLDVPVACFSVCCAAARVGRHLDVLRVTVWRLAQFVKAKRAR